MLSAIEYRLQCSASSPRKHLIRCSENIAAPQYLSSAETVKGQRDIDKDGVYQDFTTQPGSGHHDPVSTEMAVKLRIQGNSLRLRVTRSEVRELLRGGRVEEAIHFAAGERSKLIYATEGSDAVDGVRVCFDTQEIVVTLPASEVRRWGESDQVGIYASIGLGLSGSLEVSIEKDFACLDQSDGDNPDAFPNPRAGAVC